MKLTLIVAADLDDCIGRDNDLPWDLPSDRKRFKSLTLGHLCIVGSRTHDSIVERLGRALPDRKSIVVSRTKTGGFIGGEYVDSPEAAYNTALERFARPSESTAFVIGGAQIYEALLPQVDTILLTRVHTRVKGDTLMPLNWLGGFIMVGTRTAAPDDERDEFPSTYTTYVRFERSNQKLYAESLDGRI